MDSLGTVAIGAACAATGSLVTGYVLKAAEQRRNLRDAGPLAVAQKRHLDLYEAARSLAGKLADLDHCLGHVRRDSDPKLIQAYARRGEQLRRQVRAGARAEILGMGPELVSAIGNLTDKAQTILIAAHARAEGELDGAGELQFQAEAHEFAAELSELHGRIEVLENEAGRSG